MQTSFCSFIVILCLALAGCDSAFFTNPGAGEIPVSVKRMNTSQCPFEIKLAGERWQIEYLGFYVSEPEVRVDGRWQRIKFKESPWQTPDIALLKFHSNCQNANATNTSLKLEATKELMKLSTAFRFTLGLPFAENHANPLIQPSPLNDSSMFWSWQDGHKFLRLDLRQKQNAEHTFSYHLGSVGCVSDSAVRPPEKSCTFTNRVNVILPMTQLDYDLALEVSLPHLIMQTNLVESDGCKFEAPDSGICGRLMKNLQSRPWLSWD
ncbi:MbnP family copper-binding protein [Alteromonas ponticola]|uniref:Metallo-mystery pair system four-Cys motif protein n=1 Tax=Alteromonas ponticola TaxID=2720613 RepID=A0ABX1R0D6_9ALTE|nr:MbnP family copper-binding protein [Alteromonas ponticola]NMH59351.1 metallo-mystery pair system four-Cys motif protein [Alteromonas ponticola]